MDKDYFKDALFIGDSRTVGLKQYSSIKEATYFADIGMQSFNVLNKELDVPGKGKTNLENLLKNNSYKKIYLMPVSYTHLDVYKRQTLSSLSSTPS